MSEWVSKFERIGTTPSRRNTVDGVDARTWWTCQSSHKKAFLYFFLFFIIYFILTLFFQPFIHHPLLNIYLFIFSSILFRVEKYMSFFFRLVFLYLSGLWLLSLFIFWTFWYVYGCVCCSAITSVQVSFTHLVLRDEFYQRYERRVSKSKITELAKHHPPSIPDADDADADDKYNYDDDLYLCRYTSVHMYVSLTCKLPDE